MEEVFLGTHPREGSLPVHPLLSLVSLQGYVHDSDFDSEVGYLYLDRKGLGLEIFPLSPPSTNKDLSPFLFCHSFFVLGPNTKR